MQQIVLPRLHVLLARAAPTAVVIRRGPSWRTAVIGWDRQTDTFKLGQWLSGRIYERRSDLSPDGKHLIYFAMNGRWTSSVKGSWTAISRAPYLKAISLFAKGDCWHGGGLFRTATEYWLNDGYGHEIIQEDLHLKRVADYTWHESYGGECPGVYYIRLQRDGWTMKQTTPQAKSGSVSLFEKPINERWILRKHAHVSSHRQIGRGVYFDTHDLFNVKTGEVLPKENWEWADIDGRRLVWAGDGCLSAVRIGAKGLHSEKILCDFNVLKFEKLIAPY